MYKIKNMTTGYTLDDMRYPMQEDAYLEGGSVLVINH